MSCWTLIQELYDTGGDYNTAYTYILKRGIDVMEIACIYIYSIKRAHFDTVNNLFVIREDTT